MSLGGRVNGGFDTLLYHKEDGIAWVALNRPRVLNAYNTRMRDELYQVLSAIREDGEVGAVVFRGEGRAFCAGADVSEFLTAPSSIIARQVRWERDVWGLFLSLPQPVLAAGHGFVLGSGLEIALCCDLRLATEDSRFGLPETSLGIIPAAGGTQTLPRAFLQRGKALEMLLAGEFLSARQALEVGLVNWVVPGEQLLARAEEIARRLVALPRGLARNIKQAVHRGLDLSLDEGLKLEARLVW